jgi:serine/threonine protein kinase
VDESVPNGTVIGGRWRVTGMLGEGGFGRVFRVEDVSEIGLGAAALKILHPNTSPQERESFLREAQKIAQLRHQNLVGYVDSGRLVTGAGGGEIRPYLVTELCERSLDDHAARAPGGLLPAGEVVAVLADVLAGLDHLHRRGMIHRDIKPANVLYADGFWKLADFGLMRDLSATGTYHRGELLMGTPVFMAPELFSTMTATAPSDIYAVGVLAHLVAAGRALHTGAGPALMHNITTTAPSVDPSLAPGLADLIRRATVPDPAQRPTAGEMLRLTGALAPASPSAPVFTPPRPAYAPEPPHHLTDHETLVSDRHAPAAASFGVGSRSVLTVAAAGVVLVAGMVAALVLTGGGDDQTAVGQALDVSTTAAPTTGAADTLASARSVSTTPTTALVAGGAVPQPESHFVTTPCAGPEPTNQVLLVNRHDAPVDYRVTLSHYDQDGVRVGESLDWVTALPPGQEALLGLASSEEGAVRCELDSIQATVTDPAAIANIDQAELTSCVLDEFFGNLYDIVFTVTNDGAEPIDAEVTVAVVDADGLRIDESFSSTVFDIGPGETVREETKEVFWNMDEVPQPVDRCVITSVEVEPAL